ncbi:hypothetical protein F5878DRAFT_671181 [Lentinula raphanica]|uniref:DNA breaking-rejoining enzyme n=1 Tax=Lentinula raphanica TaxID=153919 RepID=A0AA38U4J0_9AGAR|nr:hypothetical protein F5878DRAFT_671181 [Lentinula raphanica]
MPAERHFRTRKITSTTPYPQTCNRASTELDPNMVQVLHQAVSRETAIRQNQQVHTFLLWCARRDVTLAEVSPPSEILLCNYFSTFSSKTSMATAKSHSTAIKNWVKRRGFPWTGASLLESIMRGIHNTISQTAASKEILKVPVRVEHLKLLVNECINPNDAYFIACRNAIACTAFYGMFRLGEILFDTNFTANETPRVQDLIFHTKQCTINLPRTRTTLRNGETIIFPHLQSCTDPTSVLQQHIAINKLLPTDINSYIHQGKRTLQLLGSTTLLRECKWTLP